jgi:hypothetical protein
MSTALTHALELARNRIPVFPCNPDKSPQTKRGFKDATTDEHQVRRLFGPHPEARIGVPTGPRFDVLDFDMTREEALEWAHKNGLPVSRLHSTRRGGLHCLFQPDRRIKNSTSKIDNKIDTRAKGGYVIWWPAHGGAVENEHLLAEWPDWIVSKFADSPPDYPDRTREEDEPRGVDPFHYMRSAENRIDGILLEVAQAPRGRRQATYFWASKRFREMVDKGLIEQDHAYELLYDACLMSADPGCERIVRQAIRELAR